jgi:hypothetical protein
VRVVGRVGCDGSHVGGRVRPERRRRRQGTKKHHDGDKDEDSTKDKDDDAGDDDCPPPPPPPPSILCPSGTHPDPCDPFRSPATPGLPVPGTPSQLAGGCCLDGVFTCPDAGLVCPPTKCGDNNGQSLCCDLVNGALVNCTPP